jgi:hypothetical protein
MSAGHGDDKDHGKKSGGGGIDFGITSMIGGFFGAVTGADAMKKYVEGG